MPATFPSLVFQTPFCPTHPTRRGKGVPRGESPRDPTLAPLSGPDTSPAQSLFLVPLQNGQIDAVTLKGEDIYTAGKKHGLVPAAGEHYAREYRGPAPFTARRQLRVFLDIISLPPPPPPGPFPKLPFMVFLWDGLLSVTGKPSCLRPQFPHRIIKSLAGVGNLSVRGQRVNMLRFCRPQVHWWFWSFLLLLFLQPFKNTKSVSYG